MLRVVLKILKFVNSETDPNQLSLGLVLGTVIGLTPTLSLHNLGILFLVLALRANLSMFLLTWGMVGGAAFGLDPVIHATGYKLLTAGALEPLWRALYNTSFGPLMGLNNTVVVGGLFLSLVAAAPLFLLSRMTVNVYRDKYKERVMAWKVMTLLKGGKFMQKYAEA